MSRVKPVVIAFSKVIVYRGWCLFYDEQPHVLANLYENCRKPITPLMKENVGQHPHLARGYGRNPEIFMKAGDAIGGGQSIQRQSITFIGAGATPASPVRLDVPPRVARSRTVCRMVPSCFARGM